ncbi:MAG: hypothetical protein QXM12_02915 [Nitrososphaerota archaeon]
MKILDDLVVCEVRAKLRAKAVLQTGITPAEACGKSIWVKLRRHLVSIVESNVEKIGGNILNSYLERDVALTATIGGDAGTRNIILRGRIDLATLVKLKGSLFSMLFEVTEYGDAPGVVKSRLQAYASALYGELGFPVIPALVIVKEQETVEDVVLLIGRSLVPGVELRRAVNRLVRVLTGEEKLKAPDSNLCAFCDPSLRRLCTYKH